MKPIYFIYFLKKSLQYDILQNGELFINGRSRGRLTSAQQEQLTTFQRNVAQWSSSLRNRILQVFLPVKYI